MQRRDRGAVALAETWRGGQSRLRLLDQHVDLEPPVSAFRHQLICRRRRPRHPIVGALASPAFGPVDRKAGAAGDAAHQELARGRLQHEPGTSESAVAPDAGGR